VKLAIFGTSGFAREVRDIAELTGYDEIVFIGEKAEDSIQGSPVKTEEEISPLVREGFSFVIGIGNPKNRKAVLEKHPELYYVSLIHPTATFGYRQRGEIEKRSGNIVCAGVRMTNQITPGDFGIYNLNCTVGHDCIVQDFVTVSPGASISGNVLLQEGAYLGANSCVIQGKSVTQKITIGRYATVGAGAVVTKSVSDNIIVKGIPAK
jgi:sugar O-acyltransferase (sialic acid O-acetyltransferase NeuD family)